MPWDWLVGIHTIAAIPWSLQLNLVEPQINQPEAPSAGHVTPIASFVSVSRHFGLRTVWVPRRCQACELKQSCVCTHMYGKTGRIWFKYVWWYVDMPYHSADLWAHPRTHSWSVELPRARKRAIQGSIAHLMLLLNKILHHLRWFSVPINGLSGLSSRICV